MLILTNIFDIATKACNSVFARKVKVLPKRFIKSAFGGGLNKSHPKERRPFSSSLALHVVFKSSLAKGGLAFLKNKKAIDKIIYGQSRRHGVDIICWQSHHVFLHFVLKAKSRKRYNAFIRSISGLVARKILKAERGKPSTKNFWSFRPFTRIVKWQKTYAFNKKNLKDSLSHYVENYKKDFISQMDDLWLMLQKRIE